MQGMGTEPGFTSELKFIVDAATGRQIREWARARLAADPHGDGPFGDEYRVCSLYFDTDTRDVFHRRGSYGRSKYRIRRYHHDMKVFLERKLRTGGHLAKRRTPIDLSALPRLAERAALNGDATAWFRRRVEMRRLHPICQVAYVRTARVAPTPGEPARLTIDDGMRAVASSAFNFDEPPATPLLEGRIILELKFRHFLPAIFKQLAEEFALEPRRSSKYRVAADALGLIPHAPEGASTTAHA